MLETDEVDDDFFTPVAGTSLANIFGNVTKSDGKANDSLKYVPPKPQNIVPKPEPAKTTECIFACALIGHEWFNNVYTARGKIGFAIVKIQKTGAHNIVLYDSNKTTLSCTTISSNLEVTIKNNTYVSYYDNQRKYWSVYGTKEEVEKVAEYLTKFQVNIKYSTYTDQDPPKPASEDAIKIADTPDVNKKIDKGSDTDSSINRKTKASILNRMANMGHSVLPTRTLPVERTSDSSDTMEIETQPKSVRHKPAKNILKRNNPENMSDSHQMIESNQRIIVPKTESVGNVPLFHTGQLLPVTSTNLVSTPSNEMGMFISEQRISNSELRINMNRITDKVDSVIEKINNLEQKGNSSINSDILMKLLAEYENKIKVYEELLKPGRDKSIEHATRPILAQNDNQNEILKNKVSELEKINQEKSREISCLQEEIKILKSKYDEERSSQASSENALLKKINNLENNTKEKDEELSTMLKKYDDLVSNTNVNNGNIGDKIKNIMNDAFQTISINFDNNENYTGETVKKIIATVIKKITIQTLSEL